MNVVYGRGKLARARIKSVIINLMLHNDAVRPEVSGALNWHAEEYDFRRAQLELRND